MILGVTVIFLEVLLKFVLHILSLKHEVEILKNSKSFLTVLREISSLKFPLVGFPDSFVKYIKFVSAPGVSMIVDIHFSCDFFIP